MSLYREAIMPYMSNHKFDLIVIGSGLAGYAATCFAVARGLKTVQVSATGGELAFASGMLDLLGIYPHQEQQIREDPWAGLNALLADAPHHPYVKRGIAEIRRAMGEFLALAEAAGLHYCGRPDRNVTMPTAVGTLKATYRVPRSMWNGVIALEEKLPTLLVDFEGMKDFSAGLMAEVLHSRWPALRARRIRFPQFFPGADLPNLMLAEALETRAVREDLARSIRPHLGDATMVGMPAVLGMRAVNQVVRDLEDRLGVGVFEISTLPPSVPGQRLREAFDNSLAQEGALLLNGRQVIAAHTESHRCSGLAIKSGQSEETVPGEGIILATGRFLGGGLVGGRDGIVETIFGLPVTQPANRALWHREQFFDHRGHPINEAGLEIDDHFRPLGKDGRFAFENVFAAGSVLAHQDWIRTQSGAGLALATAHGAVEAFLHQSRVA
ncbi:MAG: glycerol-3-phosphate dehydrogenase subunit GlpB [Syntrophobacteraceae bacterium]